ncbi:Outer membrane efflux protein [Urbifossiella limnaea]|uniref:Outer membrane efflux protein n=1 Tax=Urbifossiella limnaea TaxID=2528023 RepID=A0A517XLX4_9BACT|nr:Outer membrane efflux protein [Urbifossiella limnaea]
MLLPGRAAVCWVAAAGLLAVPACASFRPPDTVSAPPTAAPEAGAGALPITLPAALALTGANALDIQIADERTRAAAARLDRANALWLPNVNVGVDYFRHDGQIQDIVGTVFTTSRSSLLLGVGPQAVVSTADAVFGPLAARQLVRAAEADARAARNDTTLAVAVAYFNVQQARGEVAGAADALRRAEDLVARTEKLAPDLAPDLEVNRARAEAAHRRQAVEAAYERWQLSSSELTRLLRLRPGTLVEPAEEPSLTVALVEPGQPVEELIAVGLTHRPELAAYQAVVQAALTRARQEGKRPLYPTVAVRGVGSNTPGLAGGYFGGGINDDVQDFGPRFSVDIQAVWELQGLGFGNRAATRERAADSRRAVLELLRTQDAVAAEVTQAHAQLERSARRLAAAGDGVRNAVATAEKNLQGLGQTRRAGEQLVLVFRPQEAVAAVAALDQAYRDFYQAVGDHNRAQFRLYRALGHPAEALAALAGPR